MSEPLESRVFTVWQCVGCGRIDGPQPCIGVCQDRKAELVYASEYEAMLERAETAEAKAAVARADAARLQALVRRLAWTTPRAGEWERSYRELQAEARRALAPSGR